MLLLVFILGSSVFIFLIRERASETYRCPYCAQLEFGPYHRLKCFLLSEQENNMPAPSEVHPHEYRQAANQNRLGVRKSETARDGYKKGILSFLPGTSGQRANANGAAAV